MERKYKLVWWTWGYKLGYRVWKYEGYAREFNVGFFTVCWTLEYKEKT